MIGVTIGIGEGWQEIARKAALRMQEMTGIECLIWSKTDKYVCNPSWLKCDIFGPWDLDPIKAHDEIMIFDADILPMKPWNPLTYCQGDNFHFAGVAEFTAPVWDECQRFGVPFGQYFNCGMFIIHRRAKSALEWAGRKHPEYGSWLEQTAINVGLQKMGYPLTHMPAELNYLLWPTRDKYDRESLQSRPEINLHAASLNGDVARLKQIQDNAF